MNVTKTLLGLALTISLAASAFAAEGSTHRGHGHWDPLGRLQTKLSLTPDQVSQLRPTFDQMKQERKAKHEQFRAQFRSILTPDQLAKLDANKGQRHHRHGLNLTDAQKSQMKAFWAQQRPAFKAEHQQFESKVMAVLTPDQQTKFKEMEKHGHRHHRHHHHHQDKSAS